MWLVEHDSHVSSSEPFVGSSRGLGRVHALGSSLGHAANPRRPVPAKDVSSQENGTLLTSIGSVWTPLDRSVHESTATAIEVVS